MLKSTSFFASLRMKRSEMRDLGILTEELTGSTLRNFEAEYIVQYF